MPGQPLGTIRGAGADFGLSDATFLAIPTLCTMNVFAPMASRAPGSTGGITTRAQPGDDTAQPPSGSGFEAIMEQNRNLQASTKEVMALDHGPHASAINLMLRDHRLRLRRNMALLKQRYEKQPPSGHRVAGGIACLSVLASRSEPLSCLAAEHVRAIESIEKLRAENADGQRGEIILSELADNHAEMATELAKLLSAAATMSDASPPALGPRRR